MLLLSKHKHLICFLCLAALIWCGFRDLTITNWLWTITNWPRTITNWREKGFFWSKNLTITNWLRLSTNYPQEYPQVYPQRRKKTTFSSYRSNYFVYALIYFWWWPKRKPSESQFVIYHIVALKKCMQKMYTFTVSKVWPICDS